MDEIVSEVQRHGIMLMLSSAGITLIGFFATMFYAHWVGATVLGAYFLFLSVFSILTIFTDLGIGLSAQKKMCEGKDQDQVFTANIIVRLVLYLFIVGALIIFGEKFVTFNSSGIFFALIAVLGISTVSSSISVAMGASNRLGLLATGSFFNNLIRITVQVVLVYCGYEISGLIGGLVAGILFEMCLYFRYIDYNLVSFTLGNVKTLFSYSWMVFLTITGTSIFENISLILLGSFLSVTAVGIFGVCWTFSFFALFISNALVNTLYVKVSRWHAEKDMSVIIQSLSRAMTYALVFSIPIFIGAIILGERLLYYFYGATFSAGAAALVIIIGMRVFQSIHQLFSYYLIAMNQARLAFFGVIFGLIANIILAIALIPFFGLVGAALASLSYILINVFFEYRCLSRSMPIVFEKSRIGRIVLAALSMGILLLIIDKFWNMPGVAKPIAMIILGSVIYFTLLLKMDHQLREDALRILRINWLPR